MTIQEPTPAGLLGVRRDPVIWTLVLLAFVVRVVYNLALHADGHSPTSFVIDEREYFGAAHMLAEGRGFSFFDAALWVRPPLYVASLAAVIKIAGSSYPPALLWQSILSALTLLPLGWLGHRVGGLRAARFTVALGLLYLPLTLFAGLLLSETLFVFLFACALAVLMAARDSMEGTSERRALAWLSISGFLLGLAVLTRATALAFLPLVALWLFLDGRSLPVRRRLGAVTVVFGVCLLCLVPWIARNYAAYRRFVLVDTTSGYNLWLASVGVRDEPRLQEELLSIPNPADRQGYAYARAWENIVADPQAFVGKGIKESFDLWRPLFGAEERQIKGYALGRVAAWHLLGLLLFDDLLYLVILLAALVGIVVLPANGLKNLTLLWVLLWVLMSFAFFAVTRFRLPVVAALLPWAGAGLAVPRSPAPLFARFRTSSPGARVVLAAALGAIVVIVVPSIDISSTWLGIGRWGQQQPYRAAESLLTEGKVDDAIAKYKQANQSISDTRYGLAAAYLQKHQVDPALAELTADEPVDRVEPYVLRGEAARIAGNLAEARSFFSVRSMQVDAPNALDWAWNHIRPAPIIGKLEIGSGLAVGYVRGFYGPEKDSDGRTFRWSDGQAEIRAGFAPDATVPTSGKIDLDLSGWRPDGAPPASPFASWINSTIAPQPLDVNSSPTWATVRLLSGEAQVGAESIVQIDSNAFIGGGADPRLLGVRISSIAAGK